MPASVFVIVNALAKRWADAPDAVAAVCALCAGRATVRVTHDLVELDAAAYEARNADIVLLAGGDGTYGAGLTALRRVREGWPLVGLAPGGTVGTVTRSLRLGTAAREPVLGVARMLHAALAGPRIRRTPTLEIEHDAGKSLGFIVGTGLVASFFELYDTAAAEALARGEVPRRSSGGGNLAAARIVARVFLESFVGGPIARRVLRPLPCTVTVHDDGPRKLPWSASSLVVASVLRDLGLGMRVTHRGAEDPSRPHVVVSGLVPRALGPRMFRVLRGVPIAGPEETHFDGLVDALEVVFPETPSEPRGGPWVLDGDLRRSRRLVVRAGPEVGFLDLGEAGPYSPD